MVCLLAALCIAGPACKAVIPASNTLTPEPGLTENQTVTAVSVKELKQKLDRGDSLILLDVRPQGHYDMGHIEGALSMPLEEIPARYREIPQHTEVIVYSECA